MASIKCTNCNLVNFSTAETCKRCHASLGPAAQFAAERPYQSSAERPRSTASFQAPPPPSFYAGVPLSPQQGWTCIKCGTGNDVQIRPLKKEYIPPGAYLALLIGLLPGLIVISIAKTRHKMEAPFCGLCFSHFKLIPLIEGLTKLFFLIAFLFSVFMAIGTESWIVFLVMMGFVAGGVYIGNGYCKRHDLKFGKIDSKQVVVNDPVRGEVRLV